MNDQENQQVQEQLFDIYSGILFNNREFAPGERTELIYSFDCPEYKTLIGKYHIDEIAGDGTPFQRAERLMRWMAPKLTHRPDYDNHVPMNSLDLLHYSLDKPEHGVNCVNKAKILTECCLALGVYARRVHIMPYSPYDFDNHVVTEIYDPELGWVMLDPSMNGCVIDGSGKPLSVLAMREKFALQQPATFVTRGEDKTNIPALRRAHLEDNAYYCKNLFRIGVDCHNTFGSEDRNAFWLIPAGYSTKESILENIRYRSRKIPPDAMRLQKLFSEILEKAKGEPEPEPCAPETLEMKP